MPNLFVWTIVLSASLGAVFTGYYDGSMNGILEMKGFQDLISMEQDLKQDVMSMELNMEQDVRSMEQDLMSMEPDVMSSMELENTSSSTNNCSSGNGASSDIIVGAVVSVSSLGSVAGSLLGGWLADYVSRKYALFLSGVVMVLGSLILSSSFHLGTFILGRFIGGISIGIIYMVMPIYIAEVSPKKSRGMLVSLAGIGYSLGLVLGLCCNVGLVHFHFGWRVPFIVQVFAGFCYTLVMFFMPRTPRWLVLKQRKGEAHLVLTKINRSSRKDKSIDTYLELEELEKTTTTHVFKAMCMEVLEWKYLSRLVLVLMMFFIYCICGNFLYYYTATMFCLVGTSPIYAPLAVPLVLLVASFILPFFIDKIGRKTLLMGGSASCGVFAAVAAGLLVSQLDIEDVGYSVVAIIGVYAFINSCTWLTIPWVLNSEIFPVEIRGLTVAITTSGFWMFNYIVNQVIPVILGIEVSGFLFFVAAVNFLAIGLIGCALPETKGVSLEQMDELFANRCSGKQCLRCREKRSRTHEASEKSTEDDLDEKEKIP